MASVLAEKPTNVGSDADARPRVWTVFVAILLPLVGEFAAGIAIFAAVALVRGGSGSTRAELIASFKDCWRSVAGVVTASLPLGIALLGAKLSKRGVASRLALGPTRATVLELALGSIGAIAASSAVNTATHALPLGLKVLETVRNEGQLPETALTSQGIGSIIMTLALLVLVHPIAEELLFRGYVQTRLRERWGPLAGIAITSLVFGFYHLPDRALFGVIFGAYLGWVAHFNGGTRPAILAHMANNLMAAVALSRVPHAMADIPPSVTGVAIAASEAIVAAGCIAVMVVSRARRGPAWRLERIS